MTNDKSEIISTDFLKKYKNKQNTKYIMSFVSFSNFHALGLPLPSPGLGVDLEQIEDNSQGNPSFL